MEKLREKCWIIQGRRRIRKVLRQCLNCLRFTAKNKEVDPTALPPGRVNYAQVFEVTGVDLAGPLFMRNGSKSWVVLSTCAVYRAVHLDFVTTLSTESFLNCLFRFVKCRGRPSVIYSDNGTNFVGSVNYFKSLDWKKIEVVSTSIRTQWKFNSPTAAWWGGWWERLIRTLKDLLKRVMGKGRLDYEGFRTCLCHVQAVVNDRPLTNVTEDSEDLIPLTPSMFIQGIQQHGFPKLESVDSNYLKSSLCQKKKILQEIKNRFRKEYLSQLVQRRKDRKDEDLQLGDVVLVGEDNKKRLAWVMGRVMELIPGKDGKVRVAKVKTLAGIWTRPLQRLYPMEVSSVESVPVVSEPTKMLVLKKKKIKEPTLPISQEPVVLDPPLVNKFGRTIKAPIRFQN